MKRGLPVGQFKRAGNERHLRQPKTNAKLRFGPQQAAQGSHTQVGAVSGETQERVRPSVDHETNTLAPIRRLAPSRCACAASPRAMDSTKWSSDMSVFQRCLEVRPHFVPIYSGATICRYRKCLAWRLILSTADPARRDGELQRLEIRAEEVWRCDICLSFHSQ